MDYKIIVQENQSNGGIYIRSLTLDPDFVKEALRVREAPDNPYCVFVLEYCEN